MPHIRIKRLLRISIRNCFPSLLTQNQKSAYNYIISLLSKIGIKGKVDVCIKKEFNRYIFFFIGDKDFNNDKNINLLTLYTFDVQINSPTNIMPIPTLYMKNVELLQIFAEMALGINTVLSKEFAIKTEMPEPVIKYMMAYRRIFIIKKEYIKSKKMLDAIQDKDDIDNEAEYIKDYIEFLQERFNSDLHIQRKILGL